MRRLGSLRDGHQTNHGFHERNCETARHVLCLYLDLQPEIRDRFLVVLIYDGQYVVNYCRYPL